ncbi:MAG: Dabb family protein [Lunatimonas sp.]|uniref:Dabb family protein n=1 Tax=Lunatimonas sp. TaxID=2060141 RepID=UPI00263B4BD4|nr:Dabb family protein [Lunatimonas sp.]MCC5937220.1 Dabb family protein [Lunatimonas sp.]
MIVHQVFFWLHQPDKDLTAVMEGCKKIGSVSTAKDFSVGVPAKTPKRAVIDDSYHIALTVYFDSVSDHDVYQDHPDHLRFIEDHKAKWAKVQVYDFEV